MAQFSAQCGSILTIHQTGQTPAALQVYVQRHSLDQNKFEVVYVGGGIFNYLL
jgi:hypothetical protein